MKSSLYMLVIVGWLLFPRCASMGNNSGNEVGGFSYSAVEPSWIRDGELLEFDNQIWYPQDSVDLFTDDEVMPIGKYKEATIFVDKVDIKPYDRLYTKFGKNKFRLFKLKPQNDQGSASQ